MTCAVPGLQRVVFLFWAHTYVTQMPSLYCRSECRELWSVPGLMEWFISLLTVETTSTSHRYLLLIADPECGKHGAVPELNDLLFVLRLQAHHTGTCCLLQVWVWKTLFHSWTTRSGHSSGNGLEQGGTPTRSYPPCSDIGWSTKTQHLSMALAAVRGHRLLSERKLFQVVESRQGVF